jgi:hypothetical protein
VIEQSSLRENEFDEAFNEAEMKINYVKYLAKLLWASAKAGFI